MGIGTKSAAYTGGSEYIDEVVAAFPDKAHQKLKQKTISTLSPKLL